MDADGLRAEEEPDGDLAVREAVCEKGEHVEFARGRLVAIGIAQSKTLGGLTDRQRAELMNHFRCDGQDK